MILHVTDVIYLEGYTLLCTFNNGITKKVDLSGILEYPAFQVLKDKNEFIKFGLMDTIFWSNGADLAPEFLYEIGEEVKDYKMDKESGLVAEPDKEYRTNSTRTNL